MPTEERRSRHFGQHTNCGPFRRANFWPGSRTTCKIRLPPLLLLSLLLALNFEDWVQAASLDHFSWTSVPSQAQAGEPFSVILEARDAAAGVVTQYNGITTISGLVPGTPVLITEVETIRTERVEIANLSSVPVELSGWRLVFYDSQTWPNPTITFTFPTGTSCGPQSVLQVGSGGIAPGSYPSFNLGVPLRWGWPRDNYPYAAVTLLDATGRKVDFFCSIWAYPGAILQPVPITETEWSGVPVAANSNDALTYQRTGAYDRNNARDWVAGINSFGSLNSGLQLPFFATPLKLAVTPNTLTVSNGVWSGSLVVANPVTNLVLRADDLQGHAGDSASMTIAGPPPLRILVPSPAFEATPGFIGLGSVNISNSLETNLVIGLVSSDTNEIMVAPTCTIFAGNLSGLFAVTNLSDGWLDGPKVARVTASATGFASASGLITNYDVSDAGLSLSLPSSVREGDGWVSNAVMLVGAPVSASVLVQLASSNTNLIRMPATVLIPAGSNSATFAFQVLNDGRIAGKQHITITASPALWLGATVELDVADAAITNLGLSLPAQVIEGSGIITNAGAISISGTLQTNLVVTLSNSEPTRLILPVSVIIQAGQTSAFFNVTVPDDAQMQGSELVIATATAPGFATAQATAVMADNDVHHLLFAAVTNPQYLGQGFPVALYAKAIDGQIVTSFSGLVSISASNGLTSPSVISATLSNGLWTGLVTVTNGSTNVSLAATAAGGLATASNPFHVIRPAIRQLALPTQDLISDPFTARLYATVPASSGVYSNSLARLDPLSGVVEAAQYLGLDPDRLAVSDDGQFLYIGLDGDYSVRQFSLVTQTPGLAFSLGAGHYALDLDVMAGNPEVVAVSRSQFQPGGPAGIAIYDHGIKRANEAGGSTVIAFGSSNVLYGFWNYTTEYGFYRMLVDAIGVTVQSSSGLIQAYADIQYDAGRLYTTTGGVMDPDQMKWLGQLSVSGPVKSDSVLNRVYVLFQEGGIWFLGAFDRTTLALCGHLAIPGLAGNPSSLVRWGTNGLAFRTTGDQVFLIETELVPQFASADLAVQQLPNLVPVLTGSNATYNLVFTNQGTIPATGVMIHDQLPIGASFVSAVASKGTCELFEGAVVCQIGTLGVGESATITLVVRPLQAGLMTNTATISANEFDPRPVDNISASIISVLSSPGTLVTSVLSLWASDLVWESVSQRLYVTVRSGDPRFGNRLVQLNPATGIVEAAWFVGSDPLRVVSTSDPRYFYVAVDGNVRVRRFDRMTQTFDLTIDLDAGIGDLASLTGRPETIAIIRSPGMGMYENGILRYADGIPFFIEPGENATTLYNFWPVSGAYVARYQVGSNSSILDAAVGVQQDNQGDFQYDAGLMVTTVGDVVHGPSVVQMGVLTNLGPTTARLVCSDASAGRIFHLGQLYETTVLRAYSRSRLQLLGSQTISGLSGTASRLVRWGTNGLAFCTTGHQLFLLQTDLVAPTNATCDLVVTQQLPAQVNYATPFTCTVTVSNQGPQAATDVVLTDILPTGGVVRSAISSQGTVQLSNTLVTCSLGSLPPGAAASLQLTVVSQEPGPLKNSAIAASAGRELNPLDNFSTVPLPTSFLTTLSLPINDLVYDPARVRILAAIGPTGGTFSNSIVEIDPASGVLGPALLLTDNPGKLALSDDNQFVYVGLYNTGGVARVNLDLRTNDLHFSLGAAENGFRYTAGDMEVLPGQPHAVAVSIDDWGGNVAVAVYDDGVARSNTVPHREYGGLYPIAFSTNSSTLYETVAGAIRTILVDASGATLVSEIASVTPPNGLETANGLVFYNTGYEVNPVLNTIITNFQVSGLVCPDLIGGRVYFVTATGYAAWNWQLTLRAFDALTAQELWSVPFAPAQGAVTHLVKLGTNGVALTTDAGKLLIVRSGQLASPTADLQLTDTITPVANAAGQNAVWKLTVRNLGPGSAPGVVVSNAIPANLVIVSATASKGVVLQTNSAILGRLGTLANGETATITVTCRLANPGQFFSQAFVSFDQPDPTPADNSATATLQSGPPLFLAIGDAAVREGNSGASSITFNLSLSATSSMPVYFRYQTFNGTAVAGVDYNTNSGLFTFPAGILSRTLSLSSTIRGNTLVQSNRLFYLNLSSVTNATLLRTQVVATIMEDDFRTLTVTNIALLEGNTVLTNANLSLNLAPPSTSPVMVEYQSVDGTATAGSDYRARAGTLRFEPGVTNLSVSVPVYGDTLPEMDETFFLLLSQPSGAVLGADQIQAMIINDDSIPPLAWNGINWVGQEIQLHFASISGRRYRVERALDMTVQTWSLVADNLLGTGGIIEVIDPTTSQTVQGYYRLVLLP